MPISLGGRVVVDRLVPVAQITGKVETIEGFCRIVERVQTRPKRIQFSAERLGVVGRSWLRGRNGGQNG